jgi:hypothetical protein
VNAPLLFYQKKIDDGPFYLFAKRTSDAGMRQKVMAALQRGRFATETPFDRRLYVFCMKANYTKNSV